VEPSISQMTTTEPSNSPPQLRTETTANKDEKQVVNDVHNGTKEKKKKKRKKRHTVEQHEEDVKENFPQLVILVQGKLERFDHCAL
jgi:hypothetical protein